MKAILCDHFAHYSELKIADIAPPEIAEGTVRIKVQYASVGFGTSLVVAGKYQRKPPLPFVPGKEIAGVVSEVGRGVTNFKPGDRVVASVDYGAFAEEVVSIADTTWHVPNGVSLKDAVTVPISFGTSYAGLHWRARLQKGETLVVFGAAGGVGLTAVQLGRLAGARVIAVAGSRERAELAVQRGAHVGLIHGDSDLHARIKDANDGRPVDVVYDPVGEPLFSQGLKCVGPEGRILVVGFAGGRIPSIPANLLLVKNVDVIGFDFSLYSGRSLTPRRSVNHRKLEQLVGTLMNEMAAGTLKPLDHTVYPLEKFVEALDSIVERRSIGRAVFAIQ